MNRAPDGTRDSHDYSKDPKVGRPYVINMLKGRWCLCTTAKLAKGKKRILYKCFAASEMGAHRESLTWLKQYPQV